MNKICEFCGKTVVCCPPGVTLCGPCSTFDLSTASYGVKGFDPGKYEGTVYGFPAGCSFRQLGRALSLDRLGPNLPLPADLSSCFKGSDNPIRV